MSLPPVSEDGPSVEVQDAIEKAESMNQVRRAFLGGFNCKTSQTHDVLVRDVAYSRARIDPGRTSFDERFSPPLPKTLLLSYVDVISYA